MMLRNLLKKEFLENLFNQRFTVSLALVAVVCWTSTAVLTKNYNENIDDYYRRVNLKNRILDNSFFANGAGGLMIRPLKPPPVLSSLARGVAHDWIVLGSIDDNPVPVLFPFMDILLVTGIIMSITTLALSYDRISGEKDQGTLKMLVMGSVPRSTIIIGKWLGGMLSISLIVLIGFVGSSLIAYTFSKTNWTFTEWSALGAFLLLSIFYCASFYSIGLYISSKTSSPDESAIVALLSWILFTLVLPTIAPYIAEMIRPTPSASKIRYEMFFTLEQERNRALTSLRAPFVARGLSEEEITRQVKAEAAKISEEFQRKKKELENRTLEQSAVHEAITGVFHLLSPFSCFELAGAELTSTGALNQLYFTKEASNYENYFFDKYLPLKENEARRIDSSYSGKARLDITDRPQFQYKEESISLRFAASSIHGAFIVFYNLLFLALSWKAFIKYDVR